MAEDEGTGKQGTGCRDTLLERWDSTPYLRIIAPVLCVAWEAMMFARVVFAETDASLSTPSAQLALFALMAVGCAALFLRFRLPFVSVVFESVACLVASVVGALAYVYVLPLVALYACVARAPRREAAVGGAAAVAAVAASAVVDGLAGASAPFSASLAMSLAGIGYPLMLVLGAALLSRLRWKRLREAEAAARAEAERAAEVARAAVERDRALAKSRIAAELHDSVGHDLTAIIALSEGLAGATGDEQLDQALSSINDLARAGLSDTRHAVRALAKGEGVGTGGAAPVGTAGAGAEGGAACGGAEGAVPDVEPGPWSPDACPRAHGWDDVADVLAPARMSGVAATLTETGSRPHDPAQADLAYRVCREGATNAMRHAEGLARLNVSVDHRGDGSVAVAVRDDGHGAGASGDEGAAAGSEAAVAEVADVGTGMGLSRLLDEVEAAGGALKAGPAPDGGWAVQAILPATGRTTPSPVAGCEREGRTDDSE